MIVLPRKKTSIHRQLEILLPRMHQSDSLYPKLQDIFSREESGYFGEKSLDYYYDLLNLEPFPILHGLRLPNENKFFQIDTLILFPNVFLLIEVKNYSGIINYQLEKNLLIRQKENGQLERFGDPVVQVNIQRHHLMNLLKEMNVTIPLHPLVVFSNPNAILQVPNYVNNLIVAQSLLKKIPEIKKSYSNNHLIHSQLIEIANKLLEKHSPDKTNVIEKYKIEHHQIRNGVWCTNCRKEMMDWQSKNWVCAKCGHRDQNAYIEALKEYKILFGNKINNKLARHFLRLNCPDVTKRLLKKAKLKKLGNYRYTQYIIP